MVLRRICVAPGCDELALPGLAHCADHEVDRQARAAARRAVAKQSDQARKGSALYRSKAWQIAARAHLARHPLCRDCAELKLVVAATEVDHIVPHRGDRARFWDRSNWQSLCKPCHSRKTAREVFHGRADPGG